jgi:chromosome segregation ATPase
MDLDALGLNSTFEDSELQANNEPAVDRVDTSEIEGPEDFTMNMTYWMTADLPLAQIKSRKEAKGKMQETRMDALQERDSTQGGTVKGEQVVVEGHARALQDDYSTAASPVRRTHTTDERVYSTPASERSMQHDEKVRSFLSNLPDTEMEGAIGGTPLHIPRNSFLQIPRSSPPKARSLQPTVEDYDTPRKPTQETVIHHAAIDTNEHDSLRDQIAQLQSRMAQQELASKTHITELETIAAYTRSELESARTDAYKYKEKATRREEEMENLKAEAEAARVSAGNRLKTKEDALDTKMHEYGEEMRQQTLSTIQDEREGFARQLQALEESKRLVAEEAEARRQSLERVQKELDDVRRSNEEQLQQAERQEKKIEHGNTRTSEEYDKLTQQLSSVQARANNLQTQLEDATANAQTNRLDDEKKEALRNTLEVETRTRKARISELETSLQAAHFELECAQADISAKQQLFRTNLDLNARIRTLQADLDTLRAELATKGQQDTSDVELETRITSLQNQLRESRAETSAKDQEILRHIRSQEKLEQDFHTAQGRNEGLDATITALRQQLAEAHRESARIRTNSERLERDMEDANERLQDVQTEADRRVNDAEQKLKQMKESKLEVERRFKEFKSQHDDLAEGHEAMLEDVRDKAEDAVRKAGGLLEQERNEKRRIFKDLKRTKDELEKLRTETANKLMEEEESSDEDTTISTTTNKEKNVEITKLREIIRKQVSEMKTLKIETTTLRTECKTLRLAAESQSDVEDLKDEVKTLRSQNATLQTSLEDQEAVNAAMDEKLASMLSRVMKERAKTVVGKRDGQWQESVGQVQTEKELLGKVLLRQWGREEVGIAKEKQGEKQSYKYKYVKREGA